VLIVSWQSLTSNPLGFIGEFDFYRTWKDISEYYTKIKWNHEMLGDFFDIDFELYIENI